MAVSFALHSFLPLSLFLLSYLALPSPLEKRTEREPNPLCPPVDCREQFDIRFPFSNITNPECGLYSINCNNFIKPTIQFEDLGRSYVVKDISYRESTIVIQDEGFYNHSQSDLCNSSYNFTLPSSTFLRFYLKTSNYIFVNCNRHHQPLFNDSYMGVYNYTDCEDRILYYWPEDLQLHYQPSLQQRDCLVTHFPLHLHELDPNVPKDFFSVLSLGFHLQWVRTQECIECFERRGGYCSRHNSTRDFICSYPTNPHGGKSGKDKKKKIIAIGASAGAILFLAFLVIFFLFRRIWVRNKRHPSISSNLLSQSISSDPYSKLKLEKGIQTQVFEYKELEEATNNFDPSKELGEGGFGTVYHGKLRDGRFVAVKRLYENNYKRIEQFKNEIDNLSRLRHQNLVTLYGCSLCHHRELLLVYEFIPNGTVADHLHGNRLQAGTLTWPIRMSIAIETADALSYLHKVEIIHRDIKTNNILLDNNFHVKVADFGQSRLFPFNVTHVSTAPQGTPGYMDPVYHQCYQLTDKSDVYSFGVVLIELISSMPAVDINRHRHEINLASMAIGKIHKDALHELVDSTLGFDSDFDVRRMITSVAQLAFRCLQDEKEMRPSMEEVLEELRGIESEEYKVEKTEEVGILVDETALLKHNLPPSPDTVTKAWESRTTTPNTSG
ncbi:LEAF RUST 10 DISEASE-RESISTANCE LOCUS RECEPTOR-LIKE PROTEIN KINASE-like 1.1 [Magnolia sinica]|uniref:LEAF RUST 10 DISEASE-RESISTANCE LOCUS RECEPTOR-LIKE PROTEIN KINASE-like 1.1 n=1 Tax=Magnolia sinica TaxID=86752 RepID=UPI0026585592|nr:LEAF RUST 10 DISEASE-RESISTANCE LOCUS RECEPTOR-LIKE PROTEIN KINASE-like 1.1 [Magnolia sinica]